MRSVTTTEAQACFTRLLDAVSAGEEVVIIRAGKPVARLQPFSAGEKPARMLGLGQGRFQLPRDIDNGDAETLRTMFEEGR